MRVLVSPLLYNGVLSNVQTLVNWIRRKYFATLVLIYTYYEWGWAPFHVLQGGVLCIHSFVSSLNLLQHSTDTYWALTYVAGTVLGIWDTSVNKEKIPALPRTYIYSFIGSFFLETLQQALGMCRWVRHSFSLKVQFGWTRKGSVMLWRGNCDERGVYRMLTEHKKEACNSDWEQYRSFEEDWQVARLRKKQRTAWAAQKHENSCHCHGGETKVREHGR